MSSEDRIKAAAQDLEARTRADIDARSRLEGLTPDRRFGAGWALVAAAAVFAAIGGFALLQLLPGETETTPPVIDEPQDEAPPEGLPSETAPTTTEPSSDESTPPVVQPSTDRYRVDRDKVAADTADPFLNVRVEPDPGSDIVAKLSPLYSGLRVTGDEAAAPDGGTWWEVELLDPVRIVTSPTGEPLEGSTPFGWVNAAFLEHLPEGVPVTLDEVEPCTGSAGPNPAVGHGEPVETVFSLSSAEVPGEACHRYVVTFGTGPVDHFPELISDLARPAAGIPALTLDEASGTVGFTGVSAVWPGATDSGQVLVVRETDGSLSLVVPYARAFVTLAPERGALVVDVATIGAPPMGGDRTVRTYPLSVGPDWVSVTGYARPFEATLGIQIIDEAGDPVVAQYSGSDFLGTIEADSYAVMTTDWVDAWGGFVATAAGLEPGRYTLRLDPEGGSDTPDVTEIPFDITGEETEAGWRLWAFARDDLAGEALGLGAKVDLGIHNETLVDKPGSELSEPEAWLMDVEEYAGFAGPFSAYETLANAASVTVESGPADHCAGPPLDWSEIRPGDVHSVIEPVLGPDGSCIEWFAVNVFSDPDTGLITGVYLELFGP